MGYEALEEKLSVSGLVLRERVWSLDIVTDNEQTPSDNVDADRLCCCGSRSRSTPDGSCVFMGAQRRLATNLNLIMPFKLANLHASWCLSRFKFQVFTNA